MKKQLLSALILLVAIFVSCQKDDSTPLDESKSDTFLNDTYAVIDDLNTDPVYCQVTVDSLHPHVINNFASGVAFPLFLYKEKSLYQSEQSTDFGAIYPIEPIIEIKKNELNLKKVIASWSEENVNRLSDSIYLQFNAFDGNYHKKLKDVDATPYLQSTIIYVNLLNINRYGYASIAIDNPAINNYLKYKTNKFGTPASDGIDISPQEFRSDYGDAFCSSLLLGTCLLMRGEIWGVIADSASQVAALEEAVDLVKVYLNNPVDWNELVKDSKYLSNSMYGESFSISRYGYTAPSISLNYRQELREMDSLYHLGHFIQYDKGFQKYATLYPDYPFVDADLPY
jgi:hypothetical protein